MKPINIEDAISFIEELNELKQQLDTISYIENHVKNKDCVTMSIKHRDSELSIDLDFSKNKNVATYFINTLNERKIEIQEIILNNLNK